MLNYKKKCPIFFYANFLPPPPPTHSMHLLVSSPTFLFQCMYRTLIKKQRKIFFLYRNSEGIGCKVIFEEGFLIHEEMRKYLIIYEEAVSYTILHRIHLNFLIYVEIFFSFLSVYLSKE
jgi:hypothetical protein